MPNMQAAFDDVAAVLIETETHLERALASAGRLTTSITEAREEAGLGMGYAQGLFDHLPDYLRLLIEARRAGTKIHRACEAVARRNNMEAGPPGNKDDAVDGGGFTGAQLSPEIEIV